MNKCIDHPRMTYVYQKNADGDFVCPDCGKIVPKGKQNTMHYHMKKHEGNLPFECSFCKKAFLHAQTLAVHISARHSKQDAAMLKCPCCPYKTLTKANRIIHYLRKHCSSELERFATNALTCPVCSKETKSQTAFIYHISTGCIELPEEKQGQLNGLFA